MWTNRELRGSGLDPLQSLESGLLRVRRRCGKNTLILAAPAPPFLPFDRVFLRSMAHFNNIILISADL